eukprot:7305847-Ditylum_brightwellii.AAC.1
MAVHWSLEEEFFEAVALQAAVGSMNKITWLTIAAYVLVTREIIPQVTWLDQDSDDSQRKLMQHSDDDQREAKKIDAANDGCRCSTIPMGILVKLRAKLVRA